jgi:hypothetical protein
MPAIALLGAVSGGIGFPSAAWLLLRHVSIGRAVGVVGLGVAVGMLVGEWLLPFNPYADVVPGLLTGAGAGFLVSVAVLRYSTPRVETSVQPHNER